MPHVSHIDNWDTGTGKAIYALKWNRDNTRDQMGLILLRQTLTSPPWFSVNNNWQGRDITLYSGKQNDI